MVVVTNVLGSMTSSVVSLKVIASPEISGQPTGLSMRWESTVTFAVTAIGTVPLITNGGTGRTW